jgi:peptidoglycan/LPS O-acetylase OafA/YrhL
MAVEIKHLLIHDNFLKICLVLPVSKFWEIRYGVFPVLIILYLYEYVVDIPLINKILQCLGKHSLNIFLIHQFIRTNYLNNFIYSFKHFIIIGIVLLVTSLIVSILIELLKKCLKYDLLINKLQNKVSCVLDKLN